MAFKDPAASKASFPSFWPRYYYYYCYYTSLYMCVCVSFGLATIKLQKINMFYLSVTVEPIIGHYVSTFR